MLIATNSKRNFVVSIELGIAYISTLSRQIIVGTQ